jgi:3-isopropylmalate dehydrogenase
VNPSPPREHNPQRIAVLPGDGIGPEVIAEALKVLDAAAAHWKLPLEVVEKPWSADHYLQTGETLPEGALEDLRDNYSAILIGAYGDPRVPDMRHAADILLGIRFGLDLYINFRPIKVYEERLNPLKAKRGDDIDFVVFRENTEGAYVGVGGNFKKGTSLEVAVQEEIHTRTGVDRILRAAFEYAQVSGRGKVCMADKSNVMRFGHDLWQRAFAEIADEYPDIEASHLFVDALTMQMVRKPEQFEVIVTNNMFGDIVTDLGAALQGGLGMAASANLHPARVSMFEPVHGSAPKYKGLGTANPMAAVLTVGLMLADLGHHEAAAAVESAVCGALAAGVMTADLQGTCATVEVGDYLAQAVSSMPVEAA